MSGSCRGVIISTVHHSCFISIKSEVDILEQVRDGLEMDCLVRVSEDKIKLLLGESISSSPLDK